MASESSIRSRSGSTSIDQSMSVAAFHCNRFPFSYSRINSSCFTL